MNNLEIRPISDLLKQSFWIPSYQRGYRWTPQEVTDLLDDIHEFQSNSTTEETDFYCLQPLVVKEKINQKIKESVVKSICDISVVENNDFFEEAKKDPSDKCEMGSDRWPAEIDHHLSHTQVS